MLIQPRPPGDFDLVAGLQQRLHLARPPAPHKPQMPPMFRRHQLDDETGLTMLARTDYNAFARPFHGGGLACWVCLGNGGGVGYSKEVCRWRQTMAEKTSFHLILYNALNNCKPFN